MADLENIKMSGHKVLLVDDEVIRHTVRDYLKSRNYEVMEADTCQSAITAFESFHPDLVILDYSLPDGNALELLPKLKALGPSVPCILLTGFGSIELAVGAIKAGAEQFLTKPVRLDALLVIIERTLDGSRLRRKQLLSDTRMESTRPDPFLGTSSAIKLLRNQVEKIVRTESPVLLQGETGSGKGVLANHIHVQSSRAAEPFVDLNCGGLTRELFESELFGHEKGAFTGAVTAKQGLLEVANRGTVFLDEIGDVDSAIQPKLLKVLEEKRFRRLGEVKDRKVDIRLIAASHRDLADMTRKGTFRQDLFFRISTIPIRVPSLRERVEDIPMIAEQLLRRISSDVSRKNLTLSSDAMASLKSYPWPGNIRELRNTLERAVLFTDHDQLDPKDIDFQFVKTHSDEAALLDSSLSCIEQLHITKILQSCKGEVTAAAKILGISRTTLYSKIKEFEIDSAEVKN
ncbi:MAG: two component, sigma54 specific, transcriptional regulator, Fis family [Acidobacteriales bacterium]|nr:two component, sigma54 specific, transcriptional regulator, Fis family [Terriglobales bacterium]